MELTVESICLDCKVESKKDAVEKVGRLLVDNGNIDSSYIRSLHEREGVSNTFLGNGIAIPHGMQKDRDHINRTGIAVLQVRNGIEWNSGEIVYLVFGIAAKSDEHIEILGNLTDLVNDSELMDELSKTGNPDDIISFLKKNKAVKKSNRKSAKLLKGEKFVDAVVVEKTGLHARPASLFIELARKYDASIRIQKVGFEEIVGIDSMASLLSLKVKEGDTLRIIASGKEADSALQELKEAVEDGLVDEEEEDIPVVEEIVWEPVNVERTFNGVAASRGVAIAPLQILKRVTHDLKEDAVNSVDELAKLEDAISAAMLSLDETYKQVLKKSGAGKAAIFRAHSEFLRDPEILNIAKKEIGNNKSAEWSWKKAFEKKALDTEELDDPLLSARAVDVRDVGNRVVKLLVPEMDAEEIKLESKTILVADELTPTETVGLDPEFIMGICTAKGGALSHSAIIARSLGIPAVVGVGEDVLALKNGDKSIIDGRSGCLYVNPSEEDIAKAEEIKAQFVELADIEFAERFKPGITKDGHRVEIAANIGNEDESIRVVENGGEGVGLFRTEFLFLERNSAPSEEEQIKVYSNIIENLNGFPLTLRTLDVGGDKQIPYLGSNSEDNPFLGVRGIRLCIKNPDLFKTQIRAAIKSAVKGSLRLMFPMISKVSEIKYVKNIVDEILEDFDGVEIEIGIMIEVPSAVVMADTLAKYVDFFSIGTNDLTQYTLAMDRGNSELAEEAHGLDPAVLRMIKLTVDAAHKEGKWVGVCGDLAGDPDAALILTGLGVDELSMNIPSIPKIKRKIRNIKYSNAVKLSEKALKCESVEEVKRLLK